MTELSGFTAAQPLANIAPQSLRLPGSMAEVCACASNCGASQILKGLGEIVGGGLTDLIEIDVQRVPGTDTVQARVRPWSIDGVKQNGVAGPGGWVAIDGSTVVGMSNDEYASLWTRNMPVEWAATTVPPVAQVNEDGTVAITFAQPTSANRPFMYIMDGPGTPGLFATDASGNVAVTVSGLGDGDFSWTVTVSTQYSGVVATSAAVSVTIPVPDEAPAI